MWINFQKQKLTVSQLLSGKIQENILSVNELFIVNIIKSWIDGQSSYKIHTSGSTGTPKEISISRKILEYSVKTSLDYLDSQKKITSSLLCINPSRIGGLMVILRALEHELNLTIIPPSSSLKGLPSKKYDLVSLVPMQIQYLLDHSPELFQQFEIILIGGASLNPLYVQKITKFRHLQIFQTYGMTETASHVALKNLSEHENFYTTLGDLEIKTDERSCLSIKGTITAHHWIQTNDIVSILSPKRFVWQGRADFVINSGGVKIHPEIIEAKLQPQFTTPFFITGTPDERLGQKVTLVVEGDSKKDPDFSMLDRYEIPKKIHYLPKLNYTESGKIDRLSTVLNLNK